MNLHRPSKGELKMKGEWEPFFKEHGEYLLTVDFYECHGSFTVEALYQAIKERLKDEIAAEVASGPDWSQYAALVERRSRPLG